MTHFATVQQQAQNKRTRTPTLYFQDPDYCAADHLLLSEFGGQVVEDPEAFVRHIDERTLVFAKYLPLVVYFGALLHTSPAVCISTVSLRLPILSRIRQELNNVAFEQSLWAATEGALNLQRTTPSSFGPDFDIRSVANRFIARRKSAELDQSMHHLHTSIHGSVHDLFSTMSVFWLASEEESDVRQTKQVEPLGKKAKQWLESL